MQRHRHDGRSRYENQVTWCPPIWIALALLPILLAIAGPSIVHAQQKSQDQSTTAEKTQPDKQWQPPYAKPPKLELLFADDFAKDTRNSYKIERNPKAQVGNSSESRAKPDGDAPVEWRPGRLILHDGAVLSRRIDGDDWCELELDLEFSEPADGNQTRLVIRLDLEPSTDSYVELMQTRRDGKLRSRIAVFDMPAPSETEQQNSAKEAPRKVRSVDFHGGLPAGKWRIAYRGGLWSVHSPRKGIGLYAHIENGVVRIGHLLLEFRGGVVDSKGLSIHRVAPPSAEFSKEQRRRLAEAANLNSQVVRLWRQGRSNEAVSLAQAVAEIRRTILGEQHPDYATSLNKLALLYKSMGRYAEAEPIYKKATAIRKKTIGEEHPDFATSLNKLAGLYESMGRYADAEPLYKKAMDIRKKTIGEGHPDYASSLNNLAGLYKSMGRYPDAEPLYKKAMEILRKTLGEEHPSYATSLNNLAGLYESMGRYAEAEPLYKAIATWNSQLGYEHPEYAMSLNNLAFLYYSMGRHAEAETLYLKAIGIERITIGEEHPSYATSLNNLALLYDSMGRYAEAEPLYKKVIAIRKKRLGEEHPSYATSLNNLAGLYQAMGRYAESAPLFRQAVSISLKTLELAANVQSERQQLAMNRSLRYRLDSYISLGRTFRAQAYAQPEDDSALNERIYRSVLAWKGAVTSRQRAIRLAAHADPRLQTGLKELQAVTSQLATLAFGTAKPGQQETWRHQIVKLTKQRDELQARLSDQSAKFRQAMHRTTLEELQAALPDDAVLVDCLVYGQFDRSKEGGRPQVEGRVTAFIIRRSGPIHQVDLGTSKSLDQLVKRWRRGYGATADAAAAGMELRKQVWEPLEKAWRDADSPDDAKPPTILISPDGALARLPWNALPGRQPGRYLIEEYSIAVMAAPQDLPRLIKPGRRPKSADGNLLLVADVDYDARGGSQTAPGPKRKDFDKLASRRSAPRGDQLPYWKRLSEGRSELLAIRDTYEKNFGPEGMTVLQSSAADEEAFRREAPGHLYLHLVTHGFFAPESVRSALDRSLYDPHRAGFTMFSEQSLAGYHPDLLSGVVFAGANRPDPEGDDGILTAAEVSALNLSNVKLCVLSACETGLGRRAGGEGLLGVQRAFQIAGVDTVVATLWKVDDRATRDLMERFYENLWDREMGKLEALREAQLWMLRSRPRGLDFDDDEGTDTDTSKRLPPFYWAAFVLSGDWR